MTNEEALDMVIKALSQQRTGHWIKTLKEEVAECIGGTGIHVYVCSKCDKWVNFPSEYCPNCGYRMVEPQESEEQT